MDPAFSKQVQEFYPTWALSQHQQGSSLAEFEVLPSGKVVSCKLVQTIGNARLQTAGCEAALGKRLKPDTDDQGRPSYGLLRLVLTHSLKAPGLVTLPALSPDSGTQLVVDQVPSGSNQFDSRVNLQVTAEGRVQACADGSNKGAATPAPFLAIACEEAMGWHQRVLSDHSPTSVGSKQCPTPSERSARSIRDELADSVDNTGRRRFALVQYDQGAVVYQAEADVRWPSKAEILTTVVVL